MLSLGRTMKRSLTTVRFQPDFYLGPQFAGVLLALESGLYSSAGISLELLPLLGSGETAAEIPLVAAAAPGGPLTCGTTEQNILVPYLRERAAPVKAVGAMFGRSPLALAGLPSTTPAATTPAATTPAATTTPLPSRVGVHADSVGIFSSLLPASTLVVPLVRADKMEALLSGEVDAVQVYDVMETLAMENALGAPPAVFPMHGPGSDLGYSQVIFAPTAQLEDAAHRATLKAFLTQTFAGWALASSDPALALAAVAKHTPPTPDPRIFTNDAPFLAESIRRCCDLSRRCRAAGTPGAIAPSRWASASAFLGGSGGATSLDAGVYGPDPLLLDGDTLAHHLLADVKAEARRVAASRGGLPPRLGLVTVGDAAEGHTLSPQAEIRRDLSPSAASWFDKSSAGSAHDVRVSTLDLPDSTTTAELTRTLHTLSSKVDGIQLMWPLPAHIDSELAYAAIPAALDVDGANFIGRLESTGGPRPSRPSAGATAPPPFLPVTPDAVLHLLDSHGVDLSTKKVLIVGRSRIVGSPLAYALTQRNATVTLAHTSTSDLAALCLASDLVISCAGVPGLIQPDMISPGAGVVSVGVTFDAATKSLLPDVSADVPAFGHASFLVTTPGGVGPLPLALLLRNVVTAASRRSAPLTATAATPAASVCEVRSFVVTSPAWAVDSDRSVLFREFKMGSHLEASRFLESAARIGDELDHHIERSSVLHKCEEGVVLKVELKTTSVDAVTGNDLVLAARLDALSLGAPSPAPVVPSFPVFHPPAAIANMRTAQFRYELPEDRIALHPSYPRGSSKLLVHVPESAAAPVLAGKVGASADLAFSDLPSVMPDNAHLVFNESRVFAARLFVPDEVLLLAPLGHDGDPVAALSAGADGQLWRAMLRGSYSIGDVVQTGGLKMTVERMLGSWVEEGETDGVEAALRLSEVGPEPDPVALSLLLDTIGKTPIPPYFNRDTEDSDLVDYQTVYASEAQVGSVAAPTAGLHFTDEVLSQLSANGVRSSSLALHVGAGTFKPVTVDTLGEHEMHAEMFSIGGAELAELEKSVAEGRPVVPVGTTSARVLESLYHFAARGGAASGGDLGHLHQWEGYAGEGESLTRFEAVARLRAQANAAGGRLHGSTSLCVAPGYHFRVCDGIVTNFHAPDSTLMAILSAFVGSAEDAVRMYEHALGAGYRFLSYGDSSFIVRADAKK